MENLPVLPAHIKAADVMAHGVAITFDDGKTAIYSASFLKNAFPQAVDITDLAHEGLWSQTPN